MSDQQMILILIIAFFVLGCNFSCKGMNEYFSDCENCTPRACQYDWCKECKKCKKKKRKRKRDYDDDEDDESMHRDGTKLILPEENITNTCLDLCFNSKNGNPIAELDEIEGSNQEKINKIMDDCSDYCSGRIDRRSISNLL